MMCRVGHYDSTHPSLCVYQYSLPLLIQIYVAWECFVWWRLSDWCATNLQDRCRWNLIHAIKRKASDVSSCWAQIWWRRWLLACVCVLALMLYFEKLLYDMKSLSRWVRILSFDCWIVSHKIHSLASLLCCGFLQCFDAVGWVIWPVKIVPEMTYKVSSGTLNLCSLTH